MGIYPGTIVENTNEPSWLREWSTFASRPWSFSLEQVHDQAVLNCYARAIQDGRSLFIKQKMVRNQ